MFLKTKWNNGEEIFSACALWMFHRFLSISFIYSHHTQQILSNFHYSFGYAFFAENLCICFTLSISLKRRWYSQITMDLKEDIQLVIIPSWNVSTLILVIILSYCVMSARRSKMYQNLLRRILNYVLQFCHPTTVCYGIMYTNNNLRGFLWIKMYAVFRIWPYKKLWQFVILAKLLTWDLWDTNQLIVITCMIASITVSKFQNNRNVSISLGH